MDFYMNGALVMSLNLDYEWIFIYGSECGFRSLSTLALPESHVMSTVESLSHFP